MNKFLPFLILVLLITLIGISTSRLSKKEVPAPNSDEGIHFVKTKIELPDFSLPDLYAENKTFTKKDLIGKYSVINFFASWCATCRAEHDVLLRLQSEKIVDVYGVAWRDISQNTKSYLEQSGNPFKQVAVDGSAQFTKIAGINALPETWIVDKKGVVVMRFRGNLQDFSIDEIREFINQN